MGCEEKTSYRVRVPGRAQLWGGGGGGQVLWLKPIEAAVQGEGVSRHMLPSSARGNAAKAVPRQMDEYSLPVHLK